MSGIERLSGTPATTAYVQAQLSALPLQPNQQIAGAGLWWDGHSYVSGTGGQGGIGYPQRCSARQILQQVTYQGLSGAWMVDQAFKMASVGSLGGGGGLKGRIYVMDCVINDVISNGSNRSTTKSLNGFQNSLAFYIAALRASSRLEPNSGSFTLTGTWAQDTTSNIVNNSGFPSTNRFTTTQNDTATVTLTVPAGQTSATIVFFGIDDTSSGMTGASFTIAEGGTTLVTGTTSNQYVKGGLSGGGGGIAWIACPMPVTVPLSAGSHTLTIKKTDATGSRLWLSSALLPPPAATAGGWQVYVVKSATGIVYNGIASSDIALYNTAVDTVVASFGVSDGSLAVIDPTAGPSGWNPSTMLLSTDGLHPNQRGHEAYGNAVTAALALQTYRPNFNVL